MYKTTRQILWAYKAAHLTQSLKTNLKPLKTKPNKKNLEMTLFSSGLSGNTENAWTLCERFRDYVYVSESNDNRRKVRKIFV